MIPSQLLEEKRKAFVKRDLELVTTGTTTQTKTTEPTERNTGNLCRFDPPRAALKKKK